MYLHTIKSLIQFIIFWLQSEEVVLAVCTSMQYYLTFPQNKEKQNKNTMQYVLGISDLRHVGGFLHQ